MTRPGTGWLLCAAAAALLLYFLLRPASSASPTACRDIPVVIIDEAGMLPLDSDGRTAAYLRGICTESGVDIRLLFVPQVPGDDLEGYSVRRAREMRLGATTHRRGLLFVYEVGRRRLRIEITPGMEGEIPDAFAGYLMRENAHYFFNADDPGLGLRTTLRILHLRLRRAALGQGYDHSALAFRSDPATLAAGAGATSNLSRENSAPESPRSMATGDDSMRMAPTASAEDTYASYLRWLASDRFIVGLPLFTPRSQQHLESFPITRGYWDFWRMVERGQRYRIVERGDLALVYFTDDPIANPHFLRREAGVWRFDGMVELAQTQEFAGGPWSWSYTRGNDEFSRAFADLFIDIDGVTRIRNGDNRRVPMVNGGGH